MHLRDFFVIFQTNFQSSQILFEFKKQFNNFCVKQNSIHNSFRTGLSKVFLNTGNEFHAENQQNQTKKLMLKKTKTDFCNKRQDSAPKNQMFFLIGNDKKRFLFVSENYKAKPKTKQISHED